MNPGGDVQVPGGPLVPTSPPPPFKKSSFCGSSACVEVAGTVVRDGKDRSGPVLEFSPAAWTVFLEEVRS